MNEQKKTVNLNLVGIDGNAFAILAAFGKQARKEGWTDAEIDEVLKEAKSKGYEHLVATIAGYCEVRDGDDE